MVGHPSGVAQGRPQIVAVGALAPAFTLPDQHGAPVSLHGLLTDAVVVVLFFPAAFTPTCTGELAAVRDDPASFAGAGVRTVAVSCDPGPALRAFAAAEGIDFPLLSDFWPHGATARAYGVLSKERGVARRATFVVSRDGLVAWSVVGELHEARDAAELRAALATLTAHTDL